MTYAKAWPDGKGIRNGDSRWTGTRTRASQAIKVRSCCNMQEMKGPYNRSERKAGTTAGTPLIIYRHPPSGSVLGRQPRSDRDRIRPPVGMTILM